MPPIAPDEAPGPTRWLFGVLPAVLVPDVVPLMGLSTSLLLAGRLAAGGVVALGVGLLLLGFVLLVAAVDIERVEFFREFSALAVFLDLVLLPPTGTLVPEPRLRFLMTSVFKLNGRTTPCSFRKRPQALHNGWPSGFRLHKGVV